MCEELINKAEAAYRKLYERVCEALDVLDSDAEDKIEKLDMAELLLSRYSSPNITDFEVELPEDFEEACFFVQSALEEASKYTLDTRIRMSLKFASFNVREAYEILCPDTLYRSSYVQYHVEEAIYIIQQGLKPLQPNRAEKMITLLKEVLKEEDDSFVEFEREKNREKL